MILNGKTRASMPSETFQLDYSHKTNALTSCCSQLIRQKKQANFTSKKLFANSTYLCTPIGFKNGLSSCFFQGRLQLLQLYCSNYTDINQFLSLSCNIADLTYQFHFTLDDIFDYLFPFYPVIKLYRSMSNTTNKEFLLGDYQGGRTIGQGTFGKVRVATHIHTQEKVAVKTLQKSKIEDEGDIQRITRQICILKMLHHPNIAQLYQIIETSTDIHLVMEFAERGELFDYIVKHKRLQEKETVRIMQQILAGVEYIHKNGVVHRDLKPQNLLLDQNNNIKIVDFGLSNQYRPGQKLKTACGSPCYAAPEMVAGKKYDCLSADIWSCGIILFAMLCGYLPFEDPDTAKLYKKIISGSYEIPSFISASSKFIIQKILNTNPEARYSIEEIRASDWYNQNPKRYIEKGTILSRNPLEINEQIILLMERRSIDPKVVRGFITSNRHNSITAHYYLLKKKVEKDPNILLQLQDKPKNIIVRNQSPLIYRPAGHKGPQTIIVRREDSRGRDASLDASAIVNTLVEANRQKLVGPSVTRNVVVKRIEHFNRVEEFKEFPRHKVTSVKTQNYQPVHEVLLNSRRISFKQTPIIHSKNTHEPSPEPTSPRPRIQFSQTPTSSEKSNLTSIMKYNLDAVDRTKSKSTHLQAEQSLRAENILNESRLQEMNKRREQLSQQLKLISVKIDTSINELKKRNNTMSNTTTVATAHKESPHHHLRLKTQAFTPTNISINYGEQSPRHADTSVCQTKKVESPRIGRVSPQYPIRLHQSKILKRPNVHMGPFNSKCLFNFAANQLLAKIQSYLRSQALSYCVFDGFSIEVENMLITIESLEGLGEVYLVQFSFQKQWNQKLLEFLSK